MELQVFKQDGSKVSKVKLNEFVFGIEPHDDAVFRAVQSELTNSREGTHAAKIEARLEVAVVSLLNKKAVVLLVPDQPDRLYGKVAVPFLVQNHMVIPINSLKK